MLRKHKTSAFTLGTQNVQKFVVYIYVIKSKSIIYISSLNNSNNKITTSLYII